MMPTARLRPGGLRHPTLTADDGWDAAALAVSASVLLLVALGVHSPVRGLLALSFVTFVPGWAVVTNWPGAARYPRAALSVLFSLAICALAATVSLWAHLWDPVALFDVCAGVSALAFLRSLRLRRRAEGQPAPTPTPTGVEG